MSVYSSSPWFGQMIRTRVDELNELFDALVLNWLQASPHRGLMTRIKLFIF